MGRGVGLFPTVQMACLIGMVVNFIGLVCFALCVLFKLV
jgi:hypothetical protein